MVRGEPFAIGQLHPDGVHAGGLEAGGHFRRRAGVGGVFAAVVQIPLVVGDRALIGRAARVERHRLADQRRGRRYGHVGDRREVADRDLLGGGAGGAVAVGNAQAHGVGAGIGERGGGRGVGAGVGFVFAVAVQFPFVLDDRAVRVVRAGGVERHALAGPRRVGGRREGGHRARLGPVGVELLLDRGRAQFTAVDRQVVDRAAAEQRVAPAREEIQRGVGERAGAFAAALLLVAHRHTIDVGDDLGGGGRFGVEHEGVVVPHAGGGAREEDGVARAARADADAEGAAVLARVGVDDEAAEVFVVVGGELHRQGVVVAVGVPLQPELHGDRALTREFQRDLAIRSGLTLDRVAVAGEFGGGFGGAVDRAGHAVRRFEDRAVARCPWCRRSPSRRVR